MTSQQGCIPEEIIISYTPLDDDKILLDVMVLNKLQTSYISYDCVWWEELKWQLTQNVVVLVIMKIKQIMPTV